MQDNLVFADTNVVVYAYSRTEKGKQAKASDILVNHDCLVSTQVLNEYCNVCIRKNFIPVSDIQKDINEILNNCGLYIVNETTISKALFVKNRYGFSYYDSLVIASALKCECSVLFSEDMQHGQIIENTLEIVNPFLELNSH
jgi:predicted nucleic acid-binding protein